MRRRERERPPLWASWAAPTPWWVSGLLLGAAVGFVLAVFGAPAWVPGVMPALAASLVDVYWRRTRPPSEDGTPSLLAGLLYERPRE
jgi:hypothetical protein